jgi:hypothetical protein
MRHLIGAAALALLAGCAPPPPVHATQIADIQLCKYTLYGNPHDQMVAQREAEHRGVDCRTYYPAILGQERQQQQRNEAANQALRYFLPPPPRPSVNCNTISLGGGDSRTTCQ